MLGALAVCAVCIVMLVFVYAFCVAASEADRHMERMERIGTVISDRPLEKEL